MAKNKRGYTIKDAKLKKDIQATIQFIRLLFMWISMVFWLVALIMLPQKYTYRK